MDNRFEIETSSTKLNSRKRFINISNIKNDLDATCILNS
ncbi:protein of unknown function [Candidatus Nitrosocosmicus franklandus]|uniref:Uncharacterized protein n=1 Tax=Candidatus Nitrosocosmicus franklandianus TaxID=1798806 RepID=A0A484IB47_9ARCH|nr:protein of unknown function [Candidatus Nitrosocosmicus franklandus]